MKTILRKSIAISAIILSALFHTGCFTGVESTKTITMSKQEIKQTAPTAEDLFLSDIPASPLGEWKEGKRWVVADDRLALLLVQRSLPANPSLHPHQGDTLTYKGRIIEPHPDGTTSAAIKLEGSHGDFLLDTNLPEEEALKTFTSASTEALIDLDVIEALRAKMKDNVYWTRSSLWYDNAGDDFHGLKYVPVTITDVEPGNMLFPVNISFCDSNGHSGIYHMSLWKGSRRFATLFYLDDVRKRYLRIEPEIWELICHGKVTTGMTKQECRLALGNPLDSDSGRSYTSTLDLWKYDGGRYLKFEDGILVDFRQ